MWKSESLLNWVIIISLIILAVTLFVIPKDYCDMCDFDGQSGKEWFSNYSSRCLQQYSYGYENPNLPKINITNLATSSVGNVLQA